jgi:hypothetical protein
MFDVRPRVETSQEISIGRAAVARIQAAFPRVRFIENVEAPVELSFDIPVQAGVKDAINLNLQNRDELHFRVGHLWVEWFPCTDPLKVEAFVGAVTGYVSGRNRALEHFRGSHCVRAELQEPADSGWRTIATWSRLHIPIPWGTREEVRRNA